MTHSCNHCKTEFRQRRRNQFYCTQSCRQLAYVERKYTTNPIDPKPTDQLAGLANMLGKVNPEMLMQLLSAAVNNPYMTDKLTDKPENATKPHDPAQNPSKNVNSSSVNSPQKSNYSGEDPFEKHLKTPSTNRELYNSTGCTGILKQMLDQRLTIKIEPQGYVRGLFPHWENKEWFLSVHVNEMMLKVFESLRKASDKSVISSKELTLCSRKMREFCEGIYSFCLPDDYPFRPFIYFLTDRLAILTDKAKGIDEIKFKVPDELLEMMSILKIQLTMER